MEPIAIARSPVPTPPHPAMGTPAAAFALFRPLLADDGRERLSVALLDEKDRLLSLALSAPGAPDHLAVPVTALLRDAVMKGAAGLLIAHNHPGGDPMPSLADVRATRSLCETACAIGIRLLDHIIVAAGGRCLSFRLAGLL